MFQPSPRPTLPKFPLIVKPVVPVWVLAAVIEVQIVVVNATKPNEPSCELIIQKPHFSTSLMENSKTDAVKLNITSSCTENQVHTDLIATISTVSSGVQKVVFRSSVIRRDSSKEDQTKAHFLEFWVPCKRGTVSNYIGGAKGEVLLQSGKSVPISGSLKKSLAVLCEPKAK